MFDRAIFLLLANVQLNAYMIEMVFTFNADVRLDDEFLTPEIKNKSLPLVFSSDSVCCTRINYAGIYFHMCEKNSSVCKFLTRF